MKQNEQVCTRNMNHDAKFWRALYVWRARLLLFTVAVALTASPARAELAHRWTFDDGTANDLVGTSHGTLLGTAKIVDGRLELTGSSGANRMEAPLGTPLGVNKTLVAWFTLTSLESTSGGPLAIQDGAASSFDSITYGERVPGQWMNGSDFWRRTPLNNGGAVETLVEPNEIMMAITYDAAAVNKIKLYRNGLLYAEHNQGELQSYLEDGKVLIGPRLAEYGYMNGYVNEARIYDHALSSVEIGILAGLKLFIWSQPEDQPALVGQTATLTVGADGVAPLTFQWLKEGAPISGQTATNLVLEQIKLSDAGNYSVVVSNSSGALTSAVARVVVSLPRNPVTSDLVLWLDATDMDGDGQPDGTADGEPVTLWQDKSGSGNDAWANGNLTYANTGLTGSPAVAFDGASYFRTLSGGESLPDAFTMFVVFENDGSADYDTALEWGNEANGQRRGMMRFPSGVFTFNGYNADVNSAAPVVANQNYIGAITKGSGLDALIRVYLNGPEVASGSVPLADFTAAEITLGANNNGGEQWNGHIAEVMVFNRELSAQELNQTGNYLMFKYGVSASYTDLKLVVQPENQAVIAGDDAVFAVEVVGVEPIAYQWHRDGKVLAGATDRTLNLSNVQLSDAGEYQVVASNTAGSVTSVVAYLEVAVSVPQAPVRTDLVLWLDGSDLDGDGQAEGQSDGDPILLWQDKSGNGNDATASGAPVYATGGLNGRPAVALDGGSFFRTASGGESLHAGFTMVAVFENDGLAKEDFAVMWGDEAIGQRRGMIRYRNGLFGFNGYNADITSSKVVAPNANNIGVITKGLGGTVKVYLNGAYLTGGTPGLADYVSPAITVGANNAPSDNEWWSGHVAEVLVYQRELTPSELNETGLYLQFKYGIKAGYQLPPRMKIEPGQGTVTISWPPAATGWILESAGSLPTSSWTPVPGVVNNRVTLNSGEPNQFYRLRQ